MEINNMSSILWLSVIYIPLISITWFFMKYELYFTNNSKNAKGKIIGYIDLHNGHRNSKFPHAIIEFEFNNKMMKFTSNRPSLFKNKLSKIVDIMIMEKGDKINSRQKTNSIFFYFLISSGILIFIYSLALTIININLLYSFYLFIFSIFSLYIVNLFFKNMIFDKMFTNNTSLNED